MATFQYVDKSGKLQTLEAPDSATALKSAPNISSDSGVIASPGSRTLNLTTGNTAGQIQQGQNQSQTVGSSVSSSNNGIDNFNTAIMGLLKKYQTMGTKPFVTQGLDAQQEQNNRISAPTDPSLIGAAPSVQNSVRTNSANALQPTINSANNSAQTFGEQLKGFGDAVNSAKDFMTTYQTQQEQAKSDAQNIIHDAISSGSDAVAALIKAQPDIVKLAGYSPDTLQGVVTGLKKSETKSTTPGTPSPSAQNTIDNDVQAILEGRNTMYNIRQTMGRTNQAATYMQNIRDAITKVDPNFDFVASDAGGKSVSTQYVQKATAAINSVLPNIDKVLTLSNQVNRIGVAGVDNLLQKAAVQINNQKVSNFREAQKLIADEIGVALGAGTVSDMKLQLGFDVTDPSVSPDVFASNMEIVKEFIQNRLAGLNSLRYQSSTVGGSTPTSGTTSSGLKYTVTQ